MNALDMARTAYASPTAPIRTERGTEYEAFARITGELRKAIKERGSDFGRFVTALHRNRQLWTLLAANVADAENDLPDDLRARLFYLAEFTHAHTRDVLARRAESEVLLDINAAVMQGLRGSQGPAHPGQVR